MFARSVLRPSATVRGVAVSAAFTYLAVRHVHLAAFSRGVRSSDPGWLALALGALAAGIFVRAVRWRYLFSRSTSAPARSHLPRDARRLLLQQGRAGEAIRVINLHEEAGTLQAEALASAVTERLYDVATLLCLLFVATPWRRTCPGCKGPIALTVVTAALIAAIVLALWR